MCLDAPETWDITRQDRKGGNGKICQEDKKDGGEDDDRKRREKWKDCPGKDGGQHINIKDADNYSPN